MIISSTFIKEEKTIDVVFNNNILKTSIVYGFRKPQHVNIQIKNTHQTFLVIYIYQILLNITDA